MFEVSLFSSIWLNNNMLCSQSTTINHQSTILQKEKKIWISHEMEWYLISNISIKLNNNKVIVSSMYAIMKMGLGQNNQTNKMVTTL